MVLLCQYGGWKGFACDSFQTTFLWILWTACGSIVGRSISNDYGWFVVGRFVFEHGVDRDLLSSIAWNYSNELSFDATVPLDGIWMPKQHSHLQEGSQGEILLDDGDTDEEDHWRGQIGCYDQWFNPLRRWNMPLSLQWPLNPRGTKTNGLTVIRWTTLILFFNPCEMKPPSADSPLLISVAPEQTQATHQIIRSSNRLVHQVSPKLMLWVNCDKQTGNED